MLSKNSTTSDHNLCMTQPGLKNTKPGLEVPQVRGPKGKTRHGYQLPLSLTQLF